MAKVNPTVKKVTAHIQASGTEKIEGFCKNIFSPLLVGHENGKSLGFLIKIFHTNKSRE